MHYFNFNIGDYASHTQHLTAIEDIIYRRLIDWQYLHECSLPDDIEKIARLIRMNKCLTDVEQVLNEFFTHADGWCNERVQNDVKKYNEQVKKRSAAGKASANARKDKRKQEVTQGNKCSTSVQQVCNQPITNNQEPITNKKTKSIRANKLARFPEFWDIYPAKKGKKLAQQKWKLRNLDDMADMIIEDVRNRMLNDESWRDGFIPNPSTYINQDRWDDVIEQSMPSLEAIDPIARTLSKLSEAQDNGKVLLAGQKLVVLEGGYLKDLSTNKFIQAYAYLKGGGEIKVDSE